ncbi:MAG: amino acid permease [bacterium]
MELKKKYNLFTAIAMVVGIIVGSGVFFKASSVLDAVEGNMYLSILAWILGGLVMIVSAYTFSLIAANSKKSGELADMAEETVGRKHSFIQSWYCTIIYYPLLVGVLGWVCADFTCVLFGIDSRVLTVVLSFVYVIVMFGFNMIAPKIAGYLQISTTVIKLVPLVFMAIAGLIYGLISSDGFIVENFTSTSMFFGNEGFLGALCGTCFAYEGWIVATTISKELKDPKKTLPRALVIGTIIVLSIYIFYYIGLSGTFANSDFIEYGNSQILAAFSKITGGIGGTILYIFVVISCVGTLNGLCMGTARNFKSIADTDNGPKPELFKSINRFNMNTASTICGFILSLIWTGCWLTMLYIGLHGGKYWAIDISELVIIFVYATYIPMYISIIRKRKDLNIFNRFVMPILAIGAALLMVVAAFISHGIYGCFVFLIFTGAVLFIGMLFYKEKISTENETQTKELANE